MYNNITFVQLNEGAKQKRVLQFVWHLLKWIVLFTIGHFALKKW